MKIMRVEILESGRNARLLEDYPVETSIGVVIIPAGFETDFASVPQLFWSIVPPMGKYFIAAVLHDYFYREPGSRTDVVAICDRVITREFADYIFLEEMVDLGVSWWKRKIMYKAVRMFGGSSWVEPPVIEEEEK